MIFYYFLNKLNNMDLFLFGYLFYLNWNIESNKNFINKLTEISYQSIEITWDIMTVDH